MIEYPLFRRAEISFKYLDQTVDIWTTDSEIQRLKIGELLIYPSIRLQSSPSSIIEFDPKKLKKVLITNEIRHKSSAVITNFIQKRSSFPQHFSRLSSKYVLKSIAHYGTNDHTTISFDISDLIDWDWIFLTSLESFEIILKSRSKLSKENLIYVEHFF